jgi:predicted metal-dependent phosphoesterase TrpH
MVKKVMRIYPITAESVLRYSTSSKSIFKQHILHALIDYGYAKEFNGTVNFELFNRKYGSCLVEREYPDVNYVLDLIHSSGGVAVLAHPAVYDNFSLLEELAEKGKIDGVELGHYSAYPEKTEKSADIAETEKTANSENIKNTKNADKSAKSENPEKVETSETNQKSEIKSKILQIAEEYDLILTGGSDFHGLYNEQPSHIGNLTTDKSNIDRIIKHKLPVLS